MASSWTEPSTHMRVLVTVKAYPELGKKHGETVCVAGIRVDDNRPREWVRLYPVPFRDLPVIQRFKKYQFIDVIAVRPRDDRRPESWRVDVDAIVPGEILDSANGWARRRPFVEPMLMESMCELRRRQQSDGTSLGAFRPAEILDVVATKSRDWEASKRALAAQGTLLGPADREPLQPIPWTFHYRYRCAEGNCPGHEQTIIDWELGQAWRSWPAASDADRTEKIRDKWLNDLAGPGKDTVFLVGNMHRYPRNFLILGVYYPPRHATDQQQLLL